MARKRPTNSAPQFDATPNGDLVSHEGPRICPRCSYGVGEDGLCQCNATEPPAIVSDSEDPHPPCGYISIRVPIFAARLPREYRTDQIQVNSLTEGQREAIACVVDSMRCDAVRYSSRTARTPIGLVVDKDSDAIKSILDEIYKGILFYRKQKAKYVAWLRQQEKEETDSDGQETSD